MHDDWRALHAFLARYPRLFVLTGAGCSTGSGIPDYRDAHGEWKRAQPVYYQPFLRDSAVRRRYWARALLGWRHFKAARPNATHRALVALQEAGRIGRLVTQNVDRLHQRAGSRGVIDLHGRIDQVECLGCGGVFAREAVQGWLERLNPAFAELSAAAAPDGDAMLERDDFDAFRVPACPRCAGLLKPAVVFFGETVPRARVDAALSALRGAEAVFFVGTSLMVYSGFRFARQAAELGLPMAALNLGKTRADDLLQHKSVGDCAEVLPRLVAELGVPTRGDG
ncbi:MAG: NAD-dependent protein deacetylase [Thiotrichales bacterium]